VRCGGGVEEEAVMMIVVKIEIISSRLLGGTASNHSLVKLFVRLVYRIFAPKVDR
jgi:hypothetical protein